LIREQEIEDFKRKRAWLTKLWFSLLLFNFVLHLDFVEDFFDRTTSESPRFVVAELECSSLESLSSPDIPTQSIFSSVFSTGLIAQNGFSAGKLAPVKNQEALHKLNIFFLSDVVLESDQLFLDRCSGLSPPIFS